MDTIIQVLVGEHQAVKELLAAAHHDFTLDLQSKIAKELTAHAKSEERVVYPRFKLMDPEAIRHSEDEHEDIEDILAEIEVEKDKERRLELLSDLQDAVTHHVMEEETKIFPEAEQKIAVQELEELATQYQQFKESL